VSDVVAGDGVDGQGRTREIWINLIDCEAGWAPGEFLMGTQGAREREREWGSLREGGMGSSSGQAGEGHFASRPLHRGFPAPVNGQQASILLFPAMIHGRKHLFSCQVSAQAIAPRPPRCCPSNPSSRAAVPQPRHRFATVFGRFATVFGRFPDCARQLHPQRAGRPDRLTERRHPLFPTPTVRWIRQIALFVTFPMPRSGNVMV
jgi:hypothetical protein